MLERLSDNLTSIGNDPVVLLAFKGHAALPVDPNWTEADGRLKSYLSAAEKFVDEICGVPYRLRSYKQSVQCFQRRWCGKFYGLILDRYPVAEANEDLEIEGVTIDWTDDNAVTGTYVENTDFRIYGRTTHKPELIFTSIDFQLPPTVLTPYPYVVSYSAGPGQQSEVTLVTIFELAAFYYRYPEAMSDKVPTVSSIFQSHLDLLKNRFL